MTQNELRTEDRLALTRAPGGVFSIITDEQEHEVIAVRDVSASGLRVEIGARIGVATRVRVRFRQEGLDLQLNGITCWETALEDTPQGGSVVGIELMIPAMLFGIVEANV